MHGLEIDYSLVHACHGNPCAKIPSAVISRLHGEILSVHSIGVLIAMRERIWRKMQVSYGSRFIRYVIARFLEGIIQCA